MATKKLKQIINSTNQSNIIQKRQFYVMKELNKKLTAENAIVTQADKGKTIVIIHSNEYSEKVNSFLLANNFNTLTKDPTEKFQKSIHKVMQVCNLIVDKRQIKHLVQKKPAPPKLKAQLKLRKTDIPIRPVINNKTAPAYKLAKYLNKILNQHITLHSQYVVTNSTNLANDLTKLEIHDNHCLMTFDIKDLYVNIPVLETLNIIKTKLLQNNDTQIAEQILGLLKEVLSQNYFTFQQRIFQPEQGIAMGSPMSGIIAEIFLQNFEDESIKHLLDAKNIAFYTRYVDDILIIYDTTKVSAHIINTYVNNIHGNIKLNPTYEQHGSIDFLDLTITRKHKQLEVDIYRKPTYTDTTINFHSNHPIEQKTAAFRFHITQMHSLPLDPDKK